MESPKATYSIRYSFILIPFGLILCWLWGATSMSLAAYEVVLDGNHSFWTEYEEIQLKEGDIVVFDAEGRIGWDPSVSEPEVGPEGASGTPAMVSKPGEFQLVDFPLAALIGKVGGQVLGIGKHAGITITQSGSLNLAINERWKEGCWDDNSGSFKVKVELLTPEQYTDYLAAKKVNLEAKLGAVRSWIADNAIPLSSVEAGHGFEDMQPLKKIIGEARLVLLGEATHGTREFFQLKHRMLEFLANEMGFTIFGIEAPMPEAFDINEYVLTGDGDPAKALAGLYPTWYTEELLDMICWMREYNADPSHEKKLKFYGFDMKNVPRAFKVMLNYLRKVDLEQAMASEKTLAVLANYYTLLDFPRLPKERREEATASINALLARFDEQKLDYIGHTSATEWALARQHAQIVAQYVERRNSSGNVVQKVRDRSMAENIRWILDQEGPDAKMVVWAHNVHVQAPAKRLYWGWLMGAHLRRMFGTDMVAFALIFNQGLFQATDSSSRRRRQFTVEPAPDGSLDAMLAAAGLRVAAIDLHGLPKEGPVAEWFGEPLAMRSLWDPYNEQQPPERYFFDRLITQFYDALLFVEKTTSVRPLWNGQLPAVKKLDAPANMDFERGEPGETPVDWVFQVVPAHLGFEFHVTTSEDNPHNGNCCAMISRVSGQYYGEPYGRLLQMIDATAYRGKKIRLCAAVRAEVSGPDNQAYLWLSVFCPTGRAFYDNMADRPITANEWRDYEIVGDVPKDANVIQYGLAFVGDGRVCLDSVSIEVVSD
jgi:erythromycin esterase